MRMRSGRFWTIIHEVGAVWRRVADLAVAGLTEVGFGEPVSRLLVVSHQGRGVVDCLTGMVVARDAQETGDWFDAGRLVAEGIGPLAGQLVNVAGLAGGELRSVTEDGWRAAHALEGIRLAGPGAQITVRVGEEVRAFGFSGDDAFFVVGCSPSLAIFRRGSDAD
ncbi:MAG TPA: hypothetical protein VF940_28275 [Streptosporangiaceae bacterium]